MKFAVDLWNTEEVITEDDNTRIINREVTVRDVQALYVEGGVDFIADDTTDPDVPVEVTIIGKGFSSKIKLARRKAHNLIKIFYSFIENGLDNIKGTFYVTNDEIMNEVSTANKIDEFKDHKLAELDKNPEEATLQDIKNSIDNLANSLDQLHRTYFNSLHR